MLSPLRGTSNATTEAQLKAACEKADAKGIVAEQLGGHLAVAWAMLAGFLPYLRGKLSGPFAIALGMAVGVAVYKLATLSYEKESERAWQAYETWLDQSED